MCKPVLSLVFAMLLIASSSSFGESATTFTQPDANSAHHRFIRAFTCYVIDGIEGAHNKDCLHKKSGKIDTSALPQSATEELSESMISGTSFFDLPALRQWWNTWAYSLRPQRSSTQLISNDLESFKRNSGFRSWSSDVFAPSAVKQKTRVIYRSPETFSPSMSVAETYDTRIHDLSADVLETEIAIDRTDGSGNADFFSYNRQGQLSTTSTFPVGERPVPGFCLGCHHAPSRGTFGRMDWMGQ